MAWRGSGGRFFAKNPQRKPNLCRTNTRTPALTPTPRGGMPLDRPAPTTGVGVTLAGPGPTRHDPNPPRHRPVRQRDGPAVLRRPGGQPDGPGGAAHHGDPPDPRD